MARWVISPIIGTGTADDPYRAKATDYLGTTGAHAAVIPGNTDGTPKFNWTLVRFNGDDVSADADAELIVLPDLSLDHVLTAGQRSWLITKLSARGFATGWVVAGLTVRDAVRTMGRWLDNQFDVTWVNVP